MTHKPGVHEADAIAAHFVSLGMSPADAASRAELFATLATQSEPILYGPAEWRRFTPGRIEIFGKHTDYAGGHSLLAAVPRGIALEARRRSDDVVRVGDIFDGQVIEVDPAAEAPPRYRGIQRYVHVVAHRFYLNFPGCQLGTNMAIASDLPRASGMSSSSALVVGVALTLITRANLREHPEFQRHIRNIHDLAWYLGCVENGLDFPGLPGTAGVGTHGGSEDHAAILCATPSELTAFGFVPLTLIARATVPSEWRFIVASSGVRAEKTRAARDAYNALSRDASALLQLWNAHEATAASLGEALATHPLAAKRLIDLVEESSWTGSTREALTRRLTHFILEDRRVPDAVAAFGSTDASALAELAASSQRDAEALLQNQIPETVELAVAARRLGAIGASPFGAGFGGSVWAVVERDAAPDFPTRWLAACRPACPPDAVAFDASPAPPLMRLEPRRLLRAKRIHGIDA